MPKRIKSKNDENTPVKDLKERTEDFFEKIEWKNKHDPKELAISISVEANELLNQLKWRKGLDVETISNEEEMLDEIRGEIGDIMIYLLHFTDVLKIDITKSFYEEIREDERKYLADDY